MIAVPAAKRMIASATAGMALFAASAAPALAADTDAKRVRRGTAA